jgi:2-methylisocitrate lyase-like PEP mutase family enzyme
MEGNAMRPRAAALKALLDQPGLQIMPVCGDGMGARLIEEAGFRTGFVSGSSIAAMRLATPYPYRAARRLANGERQRVRLAVLRPRRRQTMHRLS